MLSHCSKAVGLPMRQRGRRALNGPTLEHQRILALVKTEGISGTARQVGVSKQWICYVVKKWAPGLKGPPRPSKASKASPRIRRPRRTVIVSFRLSNDEWNLLLSSNFITVKHNMSGRQKARAILLHHIGQASTVNEVPEECLGQTPKCPLPEAA